MEAKFRPLPLSIIDFFGVVVPGFIWLVLLVTTSGVLTNDAAILTPIDGWREIANVARASGEWLGPMAVVFVSFVIGYAWKPKAMSIATLIGRPLIRLADWRFKGVPLEEVLFPFKVLHAGEPYYALVVRMTSRRVKCNVEGLPGPQPFTAAKHLLHLIAPSLWEDLEHREGEVRLLGVTFLAAIYSFVLGMFAFAINRHQGVAGSIAWLLTSAVAAIVLGQGFGHLRVREVDYTYIFALLAEDPSETLGPPSKTTEGDNERGDLAT